MEKLNLQYGRLLVLKGSKTLVGPNSMSVPSFADSVLDIPGSRDVLVGIIGGLVAQSSVTPAPSGVYLHSKPAELPKRRGKVTIADAKLLDMISELVTVPGT